MTRSARVKMLKHLFSFERGLQKHMVTGLLIDGPLVHEVPITTRTSAGTWTATIYGMTLTYVYDRTKITTLQTGLNKTKRVLIYDIQDAIPVGHAATEIQECMRILGITTRLDAAWIDLMRHAAMAAAREKDFVAAMRTHIEQQIDTRMTVAHKARFMAFIEKVEREKLHDIVIKLSEILDDRIVSPTTKNYVGLIPGILSRPKKDMAIIKNPVYTAKKDWAILFAVVMLIGAVIYGAYEIYAMGWLDWIFPQSAKSAIVAAVDKCSVAALTAAYPDIVELAVAIQTGEVRCGILPNDLQTQLNSIDPELVQAVINLKATPPDNIPDIEP